MPVPAPRTITALTTEMTAIFQPFIFFLDFAPTIWPFSEKSGCWNGGGVWEKEGGVSGCGGVVVASADGAGCWNGFAAEAAAVSFVGVEVGVASFCGGAKPAWSDSGRLFLKSSMKILLFIKIDCSYYIIFFFKSQWLRKSAFCQFGSQKQEKRKSKNRKSEQRICGFKMLFGVHRNPVEIT